MASKFPHHATDAHARRSRERLAPQDRRAQIVRAALELLVESHALEPSFSVLAERLGISRNLIYHYFASPAALLTAVVESECEAVTSSIEAAERASANAPQREKLEAVLLAYIRSISVRLDFVQLVSCSSEAAKIFNELVAKNTPTFTEVLLGILPLDEVKGPICEDCIKAALRAWMEFMRLFIHGLVKRGSPYDEEAVARYAADVLYAAALGAAKLKPCATLEQPADGESCPNNLIR